MPGLFDLPDPFAQMRRSMRMPSPFAGARMGQGAMQQPGYELDDQQREGILKGLGRKALSGGGMVGNLLDIPGSMVRDTLGLIGSGGNWKKYNPIDQLLSPFSSENRTSSRDLMEGAGLLSKNNPGFDLGDVAGFVGDIALDPLTYVTLGASALSKGGRVAKAAGLLDDAAKVAGTVGKREARLTTSLDDLLDPARFVGNEAKAARDAAELAASKIGTTVAEVGGEKLGGMFGVGLPFMDPVATFGRGATSQKLARGMDIAGQAIKHSLPVRVFRAGFDPRVMNAIDPLEQKLAELTHAKKPMGQFAAESQAWDVTKDVEGTYAQMQQQADAAFQNIGTVGSPPIGSIGMDSSDTFQRMLRHAVETNNVDEAIERFYGAPGAQSFDIPQRQQIEQLAQRLRTTKDSVYEAYTSKGGSGQYLPETADFVHYPRYVDVKAKAGEKFRAKYVKTEGPASAHRRPETRFFPTDVVREMLTDPRLKNAKPADVLAMPEYSRYLRDGWKTGVATNAGETVADHAQAVSDYVKGRWGDELYTRGPTEDMAKYLSSVHRMDQSLEALHEFWANDINRYGDELANATRSGNALNLPTPGSGQRVSVQDAFRELGLNDITGQNYLGQVLGTGGVGNVTISREAVDAAKRLMQPNRFPKSEFGQAVGDFIDRGLRLFKNSVTLPFPSFWSRNYTSGQYMNLADGVVPLKDFAKYGEMHARAWKLWKNPDPKVLRELQSLRIYGSKMGFEDVDYTMFGAKGSVPGNPLDVKATFGEAQTNVAANSALLDVIPGWKSARVAGQTVGGTGAKVNQLVEWMNRVPLYLYLTEKKGWDKFRAAMEVKKLHFDYGDLTEFERTYMKRVFPFYTFSRKVAPLLAQQLAERPGGIIAQSIKTPARQRSDLAIAPDYVSETMALPAGTLPDGSQRYVTGFGMPWEDPLSFLGGGVRGGLLEGASRMNPLTKAPIEWMTNQTLFQKGPAGGRPLEDLDPTLGRIISNIKQAVTGEETPHAKPLLGSQALEFAVANSPLTRFATTARQMTDQRKLGLGGAVNLLTGMRVSDISPAAQDAILRERAQEAWKQLGARPFVRMSVPSEERLKMGSAEGLASDRLKAILDEISERTKKRKKQRMAAT